MIGHATSCTTFCPCLVGCQKIPCTSFNSCKSPGPSLAQIHNYFLLEPKCNWLVFLEIHFFVPLDYFPWNHLISCQLVIEHTNRVFNCQIQAFLNFRVFDFPDFRFNAVYNSILLSSLFSKVHIFWKGLKILRNLHLTVDWYCIGQK